MDISNDYYTVLGVDSQASASAIKAAFKRLALQYHPDVYKGEDAQQRMRSLLQAYQTLSDPTTRKAYDERHTGARPTSSYDAVDRDEYRVRRATTEQGRYAFPDLSLSRHAPLLLHLDDIDYQLTSAQAERLQWSGIVRGVLSDPAVSATGSAYYCQRCHHRWPLASSAGQPLACPACHAQDWAEYLLLRCTHCQAVFASAEIHDPLRGNNLYHPYELFPLCPHCRRSQWCPAENERVATLRSAAARRNALFTSSMIGVCLVLVVVIALVLLR
jgi:DnaJ-like protein